MSANKKSNILDWLKKPNINRFGIFLGIAFVFLVFSKFSSDYIQPIKLKIKLSKLQEEIIIKDDTSSIILAMVEAKGFALIPYAFNNTKTIILDADEDIEIKKNEFVFKVQENSFLLEKQLGASYKIRSLKPDILHIPYSKRASKTVPIVLKTKIDYATGFDIKGYFTLSVDSAKIIGPNEIISNISSVLTNDLKLSNVNDDISTSVAVSEINSVEIFPKRITVKAEVKRFTEGKIEVPLTIINKPKDILINYFPKTVTLSYYVDLESYNEIKASDFVVECDYNEINEGQTYFIPRVTKLPEFVKRINIKQKRIDFIRL
ncbi:hypothetical protein BWZ20_03590 [Winogradskyella sp. J14-2]|uniref:hypothetical protein n=1 Tax=Winogradskyella sp. J14-2 TaxID=1936080 RepID=UPI000972D9F4|nr:hypothetical protein [Winogradskyella sp. J14-2]APY07437.1 hypothetical protein BWZ20_03590 [Winogradskyella sp. J14-2]